ncbi:RsmE family RNA methyltransferase [Furfurilactobacillus siliginis]|uniref:Ribosomal RNA small subunit methyltransferase E n=1 Tax=Furfurilactobacillus siliginis TaxID=348151 RepID=A0A0R2LBC7_9LACO|nr:RsmE family RNA methyltransferase [Furfurilactobacillus siliginis]KRN97061.1 hypothetical protein IV55_GL000939 [Furfurilactobacillus siliginis]GEK27822.1 ribosomal RNA small subunit methyltransferase E [Furfurilactobacillus siliginis]
MQHYFLPAEWQPGETFTLVPATYKHFVQVLRAEIGTQAEFVTPEHGLLVAHVAELDKDAKKALMQVDETITKPVELPVQARIVCGVPKGDKAELIVQKATELGVHEVVFVKTQWAVADWQKKAGKKIARLQDIALNAAQQSHRLQVPTISYASSLSEIATMPTTAGIVAWEESAKQGEQHQLATTFAGLSAGDTVTAVFGPEGGLTPAEVTTLTDAGYVAAGLGPRILRTETAPFYFLGALSYALELQPSFGE